MVGTTHGRLRQPKDKMRSRDKEGATIRFGSFASSYHEVDGLCHAPPIRDHKPDPPRHQVQDGKRSPVPNDRLQVLSKKEIKSTGGDGSGKKRRGVGWQSTICVVSPGHRRNRLRTHFLCSARLTHPSLSCIEVHVAKRRTFDKRRSINTYLIIRVCKKYTRQNETKCPRF